MRFDGGIAFILLPAKGVSYLHRLLAFPGQPIAAVELAFGEVRTQSVRSAGPGETILDKDALAAYRAKLLELLDDRGQAVADGNALLLVEIDRETAAIERELKKAVSPRGQNRKLPDAREKVRKAVGIAIARTLKKIGDFDKKLAAHLQHPVLQCGNFPCYSPGADMAWSTGEN